MAEPLTPVVFRIEDGEVYALFPTLPCGNHCCVSYQSSIQHSGANYHTCIEESKPAPLDATLDLIQELKARGYRLRPVLRASPAMHNERRLAREAERATA